MKKVSKDIFTYTKVGVGLGIGTAVVASLPGGSAVTPAFAAVGSAMPIVGTGLMGYHSLRMLNKFPKTKIKIKRRY